MTTTPEREAEPISAEGLAELRAKLETARTTWMAAPSGVVAQAAGEAYGRVAIDATYKLLALIDAQAAEIATLRAREAEFVKFEVGEMGDRPIEARPASITWGDGIVYWPANA